MQTERQINRLLIILIGREVGPTQTDTWIDKKIDPRLSFIAPCIFLTNE